MKAALHCDPERHGYAWHVECGGEQIVTASTDPEHDACRVLAERGLAGPIEFVDGETGRPRIRFSSIETAAQWRISDESRDGLRLRRASGPDMRPSAVLIDAAGTGHRTHPKSAFSASYPGEPS